MFTNDLYKTALCNPAKGNSSLYIVSGYSSATFAKRHLKDLSSIDKNIDVEYNKYNGFGSMRGYSIFTRNSLIVDIKKEIEQKKIELAIELIKKKSNILVWMNNILYRPPDEDGKNEGVRYIDVKKSFEDHVKTSCEN